MSGKHRGRHTGRYDEEGNEISPYMPVLTEAGKEALRAVGEYDELEVGPNVEYVGGLIDVREGLVAALRRVKAHHWSEGMTEKVGGESCLNEIYGGKKCEICEALRGVKDYL